MTRVELIRKLLETNHLNVNERRRLDPRVIQYSELLAVIRDAIEREGRFGTAAGTLEKSDGGKYRWTDQPGSRERAAAATVDGGEYLDPETGISYSSLDAMIQARNAVVAPGTSDYPSLDSASRAIVGQIMSQDALGLGSPGTIDGIEISGIPAAEPPPRTIWERIRSPFGRPAPVPAPAPAPRPGPAAAADIATSSRELTAAIMRARQGHNKDAVFLRDMLRTHNLLIPLAKSVIQPSNIPGGREFEINDQEPISVHLVPGPRQQKFCPLFSEHEILAPLASRLGWTTDGGPIRLLQIRGIAALGFAVGLVEAGIIHGAVLNPFHETVLPLSLDEITALLNEEPADRRP